MHMSEDRCMFTRGVCKMAAGYAQHCSGLICCGDMEHIQGSTRTCLDQSQSLRIARIPLLSHLRSSPTPPPPSSPGA